MAFLDELARLNAQNFMGGLAQYGEAIKQINQNKALNVNYENFRRKLNDLETTDQQLSDFKGEIIKETGGNVIGQDYKKVSKDVEAGMNLMKTLDQMGAYANLYQPFIASFATLGEDGVKIANTLSRELGAKLDLLQKKSEIPFKEMEYKALQQQYDFNVQKMEQMQTNAQLQADAYKVSDFAIDLIDQFADIDTFDPRKVNEFNAKMKAITDQVKQHFGGQVSDGAIQNGLALALSLSGKVTLKEKPVTGSGSSPMENFLIQQQINQGKMLLQNYSDRMGQIPSNLREAWRRYERGEASIEALEEEGFDSTLIKEMHDIYGANGKYMELQSMIAGFMGGKEWFSYNGSGLGKKPILDGTQHIFRLKKSTGFIEGLYDYNPFDIYKLEEINKKRQEDLKRRSKFQNREGVNSPSNYSIFNEMFDYPVSGANPSLYFK